MAPIAVGDTIPDGNLIFVNEEEKLETVSIYSLIAGKKVLIIGVPGAFMPDCRWWFKPEEIRKAFRSRSYQQTLFISVNDPYVMWFWERIPAFPRNFSNVKFLADYKAVYVTSLGLDLDLTSRGFGVRSKMFAMAVDDGKIVQYKDTERIWTPPLSFFKKPTANVSRAPIAVGDVIPDGTLTFINQKSQIEPVSVHSIITCKKAIVLGIRGAFLPTSKHFVRSFIEKADEFKLMGVQEILCISVNDAFVMKGWKWRYFKNDKHINFLADSTAAYVTSLGLETHKYNVYGIRSMRFALLLEDCRVKVVEVVADVTSNDTPVAENMLVAMAGAELRAMEI